jgi:uncharacterized protein (DUF302 family)
VSNEIAILRYTVRERFETVVEALRNALEARGLRLAAQMDMSSRIRRTLGITLPACMVIFVASRPGSLAAEPVSGFAATCFPMHLVIAEHTAQTWVHVQDRVSAQRLASETEDWALAAETQRQVIEAIETVATRVSVLA